jgi:photosystem II stability/assembly factor-like uncharacterized protein
MSVSSLLRTMRSGRPRSRSRQKPTSRKPYLELLEDRTLLSSGITLSTTSWTPIGPAPIVNTFGLGNLPASGRIATIAADPTNANTIYIGAAGGGVWKTTDGGTTWSPLTDNQATLSMGAIAVAPSNPNIIYAGTGEPDNSNDSFYGRGILKSTDAGATWALLTGNAGVNEFDRKNIAKIVVDPTNANTVYVAVTQGTYNGILSTNGIYKSTDGGQTWTNSTAGITTDPLAFFTDVVLDPTRTQTLYAAVGTYIGDAANGVYRSTDGGTTWSIAGNFPMGSGDGLIKVAIAPSAPQTLFASIATPGLPAGLLEMLMTTDGGTTWTALTKTPNYMGNQGWYNTSLAVDPSNPNIVYAGGQNSSGFGQVAKAKGFIESTDGGNTWTDIATGAANQSGPHTDHHAIAFDANGKLLDGTDGGIWRLDNPNPKNVVWTDINGNLNTITFTGIALDPTNPSIAYGGSQDNGTEKFTGSLGWTQIGKFDGGFVRVDPTHPNTVYSTYEDNGGGGWFLRSDDGGTTWESLMNGINGNDSGNFFVPYVMDPSNSSRLVLGTNRVYETTDRANHWTPISTPNANGWNSSQPIGALGLPFGDPNTIYAITGDAHLFVTTDHGNSWHQRDIPGLAPFFINISPMAGIAVDPANEAVAYVVVDEFSGRSGGYIFRTSDFGQHWTDISGNLPNVPTSVIVLDSRTHVLYVGTDIGVYASNNGGATWARFQTGMPNVRVVDLELCPALNILAAGTNGRGMWEISVPTGASSSAMVAGLSSLQVGVPTLASPMLSTAAAGGGNGATLVGDSLAATLALTLPGQAATLLPAATTLNGGAAPALARQGIDEFFAAIDQTSTTGNQALGGAAGMLGSAGQGIGGGLYVAAFATADGMDTDITGNLASTSNDDVFGVFNPSC